MRDFLDTTDPALRNEIDSLKQALACKSYEEDMDFLFSDLDRLIFNQPGWPVPYWVAKELVFQTCYERGMFEPLALTFRDQRWPPNPDVSEFLERAEWAKRPDMVESILRTLADNTVAILEDSLRDPTLSADERENTIRTWHAHANSALERLEQYFAQARQNAEQRLTAERRNAIERLSQVQELAPPLACNMDEDGFWEILATTSGHSNGTQQACRSLIRELERFDCGAIRAFHRIYGQQMRNLYHWNVWALAFAARGGCSDDAFHEFRAFIILQGKRELLEIAINAPDLAAMEIPKDPELPGGGLFHCISAAHYTRCGKALSAVKTAAARPLGKSWSEADFAERFPLLAARY